MGKRATLTTFLGLGLTGAVAYRFRRELLARVLRLPAAQHSVAVERDLRVPMADGLTLRADHYYPRTVSDAPTILVRTPYGRAGELGVLGGSQTLLYSLFAERGYHVVVQTTRGRFQSEGEFDPFVHEAADGRATMEWIAQQPWFNGKLGLWGPSYLGYVQWALAADAPPYLKAMVPMVTSSRFSQLFYPNGVFALDGALRWSYQVRAMEGTRKRMDVPALLRTVAARRSEALKEPLDHLPVIEADFIALNEPVGFYRDWLRHTDTNGHYWQQVDHRGATTKVEAPVHLVAGWYDIFLRDQLADYVSLLAAGRTPYLTVGPQHHLESTLLWDGLREGLNWFAVHLKGERERQRPRPVRVYVMGAEEWHEMDFWPPPAQITRYFLHPGAALAPTAAPADTPPDTYHYDPANPPPVLGGPLLNAGAGPRDQRPLEARADVLTFTSAPLAGDLDVIGPVRLELYLRSSRPHTDFVGRLCDVYPDGRSINVCDGLFRVAPEKGDTQPDGSLRIEIDMWATAQRFRRGHRLRLQVTSAAHPRWSRNLGMGEALATATRMAVATQTIYHDAEHPSALVLPIVSNQQAASSSA